MIKVVVIKFKSGGKLYYFAPKEGETYTRDMPVIVETSKGLEFAWVAYPEKQVTENEITPPLKSVVRIATEKDKLFYKFRMKYIYHYQLLLSYSHQLI